MQKLYGSRGKGFEMVKLAKHWSSYGSHLGWTQIEKEITAPFKAIETLSQNTADNLTGCESNPILYHSRVVWAKLHKMLRISQYRKDYASIWNNPSIKIDRKPFLWKSWLEGNLNKIGDLYKDGVFVISRN